MKNKILSITLVLTMLLSFMPVIANAEIVKSGTCGTNLTWTLDDEGTLTISGEGGMRDYSSSSYAPWYNNRSEIKTAVIEDGVTSIGNSAFRGCSGITSVTIPDSVTSIGYSAFYGCSGLTSITIPDGVTSIDDSAFYGCSGLETVYYNAKNCTKMGAFRYYVFRDCTSLKEIYIGDNVETIPAYAFETCGGITSITIPDSVTSIGDSAFRDCRELTSVYISDLAAYLNIDFENIYSNPVYYASKLYLDNKRITGALTVPSDVKQIPAAAFHGCDGITSVTIPDSVTSIGDYAFYNCSGLTSVTIPDSVTSIGDYAFRGCSGLTSVTIPDGVTSIGSYAFHSCSGITSVTIPDGVTSIGSYAFEDCSGLTNITIPDSVTSIGSYAFEDCSKLETVYYNATNCTTMGSSYYHVFIGCTSLKEIYIGDNVETIPAYAFFDCSGLTSVTIPDGVTSIGERAFYGCSGLLSVIIGNNMASIDSSTFSSCKNLKKIFIPKSMVEIEQSAFSGCDALTTVEYGGNEDDWNEMYIGNNNDILKNATIHYNSTPENAKLTDSDYLTYTVNDDNTITVISCYKNAININIPSEIDGVPVTSINSSAFANMSKLKNVTIPDSVTSIGERAFYYCGNLTDIVIPDGVTTIESNTFYNCGSLKNITVPDSVTSIGSYAFYNCNSLTDVYYSGTEEQWKSVSIDYYGNGALTGANIYYNGVTSTPKPTPIPITQATVTKTETDTAWNFEVSVEQAYEDSFVYAAIYDTDGNLVDIRQVPLNISGSTIVDVNKSDNDDSAKIFVWTDFMQPVTYMKEIDL